MEVFADVEDEFLKLYFIIGISHQNLPLNFIKIHGNYMFAT